MSVPHQMTPKSITLMLDGRHRQLDSTHVNFAAVKDKLLALSNMERSGDATVSERAEVLDALRGLIDIPAFIGKASEGRIQVADNEVRYDGKPIHGHVAERLIWLLKEGADLGPLMKFLNRLHNSHIQPKEGVDLRDEFLHWVEASKMPFTEDGCILAYKFVNVEYKDNHTGRIDNRVGAAIPRIAPDAINTDRNQTCATSGYHFCSFGYLGTGNPHVMIVKIAPEDIASFPYDSETAKGRCLWYQVISEVPADELNHRRIETHAVLVGDQASVDDAITGRRTAEHYAEHYSVGESEDEDEDEADEETELDDATFAAAVRRAHNTPTTQAERSSVGRERWLARLKGTKVGGKRLTPERLAEMVLKHGQREVSRRTGIPRATLQGWLE